MHYLRCASPNETIPTQRLGTLYVLISLILGLS